MIAFRMGFKPIPVFYQRKILEEHLLLKYNILGLILSLSSQCLCTPPHQLSLCVLEIKDSKALGILGNFLTPSFIPSPFLIYVLFVYSQIGLYIAQASPGTLLTLVTCASIYSMVEIQLCATIHSLVYNYLLFILKYF